MDKINVAAPKTTTAKQPRALDDVYRIIDAVRPKRSTIEILRDVMVRDGILHVTDLEVWATVPAPAGVPDGLYTPYNGALEPSTRPVEDFPICTVKGEPAATALIDTRADAAWQVFEQLRTYRSRDQSHPALMGYAVQWVGQALRLTSTDGYRLAVRDVFPLSMQYDIAPDSILAPVMCELLYKLRGREYVTLQLVKDGDQYWHRITAGAWGFTAKPVDGTYPTVRNVVPAEFKYITTFGRAALLAAVQALKPYACPDAPMVDFEFDAWLDGLQTARVRALDIERGFDKFAEVQADHEDGAGAGYTAPDAFTLLMPVHVPDEEDEEGNKTTPDQPTWRFNLNYVADILTGRQERFVTVQWIARARAFSFVFHN